MKEVKKIDRETRRRIIRRRRTILGTISGILGFGGVLVMVAAEGGCKADTLSFGQSILVCIAGLVLVGLGLFGAWILDSTSAPRSKR